MMNRSGPLGSGRFVVSAYFTGELTVRPERPIAWQVGRRRCHRVALSLGQCVERVERFSEVRYRRVHLINVDVPKLDWPLSDPCPHWCTNPHDPGDHPDDRVHESAGATADMLVPHRHDGSAIAADVAVYATRRAGENTTWLTISSGPGNGFAVRLDFGHTLMQALREVLNQTLD